MAKINKKRELERELLRLENLVPKLETKISNVDNKINAENFKIVTTELKLETVGNELERKKRDLSEEDANMNDLVEKIQTNISYVEMKKKHLQIKGEENAFIEQKCKNNNEMINAISVQLKRIYKIKQKEKEKRDFEDLGISFEDENSRSVLRKRKQIQRIDAKFDDLKYGISVVDDDDDDEEANNLLSNKILQNVAKSQKMTLDYNQYMIIYDHNFNEF